MKIDIRELELDDANFILEIENNRNIWKVSHTLEEFSKKEIEIFIARNIVDGLSNSQKRWIIVKDNEKCGCIDLFDFDKKNKRAGIGIVIHEDFQSQGIGSKALKNFIIYCKNKLKLHQLYCTILSDNYSSIRLFKKNNFEETGRRLDWTYYNNEYYDEIFYQLIFK
jgi:diamine N-acetyltransferase